jgi:hypothetical protein
MAFIGGSHGRPYAEPETNVRKNRLTVKPGRIERDATVRSPRGRSRAEQVIDLIDHGVEELHFYTMIRADLVFAICRLIGLRAKPKVAAEAA